MGGGRCILRVTQQTPLSALNNLKIAHLNIRASGQTLVKPQAIILHFVRKTTDIMCFTKVKISKKNYNFYHHKDYNTYHNLPDNHLEQAPKEGLIILIRKTLCYNQPTITHTHPGKATTILFKFPNLTPTNTSLLACLTTPLLTHGEPNIPIRSNIPGTTNPLRQELISPWSQTTCITRSLIPATPPRL